MESLIFGETICNPDTRTLYDTRDVIADKEWLKTADNFDLYYMYRELAQDREELKLTREFGVRYDITVIPPSKLGKEFVKTVGHYHPKAPGADISFSEIYQVLKGEAIYLLQKASRTGKIVDVRFIKAKKGDIIFIPPDYGHITINRSKKTLKMANWVCRNFLSLYEPIKQFGGGAYFLLEEGFIKNQNYCFIPEIKWFKPEKAKSLGLSPGEDMYKLVKNLEILRFLKEPQSAVDLSEQVFVN